MHSIESCISQPRTTRFDVCELLPLIRTELIAPLWHFKGLRVAAGSNSLSFINWINLFTVLTPKNCHYEHRKETNDRFGEYVRNSVTARTAYLPNSGARSFQELVLTSVECTVRSFRIYSIAHPLGNDFLLPLVHRTTWMLCEPVVCNHWNWIKITEKNSTSTIWLDMNVCILKVGKSTLFRNGTKRIIRKANQKQESDQYTWPRLEGVNAYIQIS